MKWTKEQQAAIDAPKPGTRESQTVLVAAAAGSGKTAVLVERIIQRLQSKENPLKINELLVLTFTKAAAGEMKTRIGAKLAEVYNETHNPLLEEQLNVLPSAQISTIHSFCQWVIRNYFYELDLDPSARIANEGELTLLRAEVMEELLQAAYEEGSHHIYELADMFGDDRSDDALKNLITRMYDFSRAQENPRGWLRRLPEMYSLGDTGNVINSDRANSILDCSGTTNTEGKPVLELTLWGASFLKQQKQLVAELETNYAKMKDFCARSDGPVGWDGHCSLADVAIATMKMAVTWDDMYYAVQNQVNTIKFINFTQKKETKAGIADGTIDPGIVAMVIELGKHNKEILRDMAGGVFALNSETWLRQIEDLVPYAQGLSDMTLAFDEAYATRKKAEGIIDFSDLEHFCLQLLTEDGQAAADGTRQPSAVAKELQQLFQEVMIDEYQDTNGVQEAIVNLVSRKDNRFYVGDVKQSIYRFRMADPTLFMDKYKEFATDALEVEERRIDLAKNFRSHDNILAATNFVFSQIMTEEAAELNYGEAEALVAGRDVVEPPEEWVGGPVEVHLVEVVRGGYADSGASDGDDTGDNRQGDNGDDGEEGVNLSNLEQEIQCIVEQLLKLKHEKKQVQEKDGTFREFRWRDAVILLRSIANRANLMVDALRVAGIPAYAEEKGGYFDAMEVRLMLSLLSIIDNPEQDLLMAAVLRSPLVGVDVNVLGRLRASGEGSLWSLLPEFATESENSLPILKDFVSRLEAWRTAARRHSVSDLIWQVYEEMSLLDYVGAMSNGLLRRANLMAFYERAKEYEAGNFRGLFRFLRFIDSLQEAGEDLSLAKTVGETDDVVRIMSIHKSKGLEFPVVFLSTTGTKFNLRDLNARVLLHNRLGVGLRGYFPDLRVSYPSLPWLYVRNQLELAAKAEEERVLYVALTRAKDKLFITGQVSLSSLAKMLGPVMSISEEKLPTSIITSANSFLSWILMALSRHIDGNALRVLADVENSQMGKNLPYRNSRWQLVIHEAGTYQTTTLYTQTDTTDLERIRTLAPAPAVVLALPDELLDRLHYVYPYEGSVHTPAKISVSEIKRRFAEQEEEALSYKNYMDDEKDRNDDSNAVAADIVDTSVDEGEDILPAFEGIPNFLSEGMEISGDSGKPVITGVQRGTVVHTVMQWLPIQPYTKATMARALDALVENGYVSQEERAILSETGLCTFFAGTLGKRLIASNRVERELSFSLLLGANRFYIDTEDTDEVFLQGVMDMAFLEDDHWVLVDYKTDRVKTAEELVQRYRIQIDLYKEALSKLTGIPVKAAYLYSFALNEAVEIG